MNGHSPGALAATCPSSAGFPAPTRGDGGAAIVLHAAVPGRARLHVPRLYRDDAACDALVGTLCDGKLIRSAHQVNAATSASAPHSSSFSSAFLTSTLAMRCRWY
jgi:hypothetical protein